MQGQPIEMSQRSWIFLTDLFIAPGGRIAEAALTESGREAMDDLEKYGYVRTRLFSTNQRGESRSLHPYWMLTDSARVEFEGMSRN